jgi:hypothetical protein
LKEKNQEEKMKIISKRNGREIILLNTGYSGRNTCIVSREGNSFSWSQSLLNEVKYSNGRPLLNEVKYSNL